MSTPRFVWYELMTTDTAAASTFYGAVLGWTAQDSGLSDRSYTIFSAGGIPVAGLMAIPAEAAGRRPGWIGDIAVDDVGGFARRVTEAGGNIHRAPEDIPTVGRFAVAGDPHGAIFVLFQPTSSQPGPQAAPGTPGHVGWHELHAGERESAFAFYSGLFGWTKDQAVDMGPMGIYQTFASGGPAVGGMMTKTDAIPQPFWLFYFNVEAIDAAAGRVIGSGGRILNGPHQVPGESWIVRCVDPQGAPFAIVSMRR